MTTVLRRLVLLLTLMFWQGGFMFYGAVVVPVGSEVLDSHIEQGFITRAVTNYLNLVGAIALMALAWDLASGSPRLRQARWALWCVLVVTLGLLALLHFRMDSVVDVGAMRVNDQSAFRIMHRCYLTISTAQWAMTVILVCSTINAWRLADAETSA